MNYKPDIVSIYPLSYISWKLWHILHYIPLENDF